MDVPNIAAVLKDWAQPFPTPQEWIDDDDPSDTGGRHHRA
jgi:death-on-curing protein